MQHCPCIDVRVDTLQKKTVGFLLHLQAEQASIIYLPFLNLSR